MSHTVLGGEVGESMGIATHSSTKISPQRFRTSMVKSNFQLNTSNEVQSILPNQPGNMSQQLQQMSMIKIRSNSNVPVAFYNNLAYPSNFCEKSQNISEDSSNYASTAVANPGQQHPNRMEYIQFDNPKQFVTAPNTNISLCDSYNRNAYETQMTFNASKCNESLEVSSIKSKRRNPRNTTKCRARNSKKKTICSSKDSIENSVSNEELIMQKKCRSNERLPVYNSANVVGCGSVRSEIAEFKCNGDSVPDPNVYSNNQYFHNPQNISHEYNQNSQFYEDEKQLQNLNYKKMNYQNYINCHSQLKPNNQNMNPNEIQGFPTVNAVKMKSKQVHIIPQQYQYVSRNRMQIHPAGISQVYQYSPMLQNQNATYANKNNAIHAQCQNSFSQQTSNPQQNISMMMTSPLSKIEMPSADLLRNIAVVPFGWKRFESNEGQIIYVSPSGSELRNLMEVCEYLTQENTCKCGLQCPLRVENTFFFDPKIPHRLTMPEEVTSCEATKGCNHRRKLAQAFTDHVQKKAIKAEDGRKKIKRKSNESIFNSTAITDESPMHFPQPHPAMFNNNQMFQSTVMITEPKNNNLNANVVQHQSANSLVNSVKDEFENESKHELVNTNIYQQKPKIVVNTNEPTVCKDSCEMEKSYPESSTSSSKKETNILLATTDDKGNYLKSDNNQTQQIEYISEQMQEKISQSIGINKIILNQPQTHHQMSQQPPTSIAAFPPQQQQMYHAQQRNFNSFVNFQQQCHPSAPVMQQGPQLAANNQCQTQVSLPKEFTQKVLYQMQNIDEDQNSIAVQQKVEEPLNILMQHSRQMQMHRQLMFTSNISVQQQQVSAQEIPQHDTTEEQIDEEPEQQMHEQSDSQEEERIVQNAEEEMVFDQNSSDIPEDDSMGMKASNELYPDSETDTAESNQSKEKNLYYEDENQDQCNDNLEIACDSVANRSQLLEAKQLQSKNFYPSQVRQQTMHQSRIKMCFQTMPENVNNIPVANPMQHMVGSNSNEQQVIYSPQILQPVRNQQFMMQPQLYKHQDQTMQQYPQMHYPYQMYQQNQNQVPNWNVMCGGPRMVVPNNVNSSEEFVSARFGPHHTGCCEESHQCCEGPPPQCFKADYHTIPQTQPRLPNMNRPQFFRPPKQAVNFVQPQNPNLVLNTRPSQQFITNNHMCRIPNQMYPVNIVPKMLNADCKVDDQDRKKRPCFSRPRKRIPAAYDKNPSYSLCPIKDGRSLRTENAYSPHTGPGPPIVSRTMQSSHGADLTSSLKKIHCSQATSVSNPSFMEDPSGYLAQQTALLNSTMLGGAAGQFSPQGHKNSMQTVNSAAANSCTRSLNLGETPNRQSPAIVPLPSNVPLPARVNKTTSNTSSTGSHSSVHSKSPDEQFKDNETDYFGGGNAAAACTDSTVCRSLSNSPQPSSHDAGMPGEDENQLKLKDHTKTKNSFKKFYDVHLGADSSSNECSAGDIAANKPLTPGPENSLSTQSPLELVQNIVSSLPLPSPPEEIPSIAGRPYSANQQQMMHSQVCEVGNEGRIPDIVYNRVEPSNQSVLPGTGSIIVHGTPRATMGSLSQRAIVSSNSNMVVVTSPFHSKVATAPTCSTMNPVMGVQTVPQVQVAHSIGQVQPHFQPIVQLVNTGTFAPMQATPVLIQNGNNLLQSPPGVLSNPGGVICPASIINNSNIVASQPLLTVNNSASNHLQMTQVVKSADNSSSLIPTAVASVSTSCNPASEGSSIESPNKKRKRRCNASPSKQVQPNIMRNAILMSEPQPMAINVAAPIMPYGNITGAAVATMGGNNVSTAQTGQILAAHQPNNPINVVQMVGGPVTVPLHVQQSPQAIIMPPNNTTGVFINQLADGSFVSTDPNTGVSYPIQLHLSGSHFVGMSPVSNTPVVGSVNSTTPTQGPLFPLRQQNSESILQDGNVASMSYKNPPANASLQVQPNLVENITLQQKSHVEQQQAIQDNMLHSSVSTQTSGMLSESDVTSSDCVTHGVYHSEMPTSSPSHQSSEISTTRQDDYASSTPETIIVTPPDGHSPEEGFKQPLGAASSDENRNEQMTVVFGHHRGQQYWPAQIMKQDGGEAVIQWYGDHQIETMPLSSLSQIPSINRKTRRSNRDRAALDEAIEESRQGNWSFENSNKRTKKNAKTRGTFFNYR